MYVDLYKKTNSHIKTLFTIGMLSNNLITVTVNNFW